MCLLAWCLSLALKLEPVVMTSWRGIFSRLVDLSCGNLRKQNVVNTWLFKKNYLCERWPRFIKHEFHKFIDSNYWQQNFFFFLYLSVILAYWVLKWNKFSLEAHVTSVFYTETRVMQGKVFHYFLTWGIMCNSKSCLKLRLVLWIFYWTRLWNILE